MSDILFMSIASIFSAHPQPEIVHDIIMEGNVIGIKKVRSQGFPILPSFEANTFFIRGLELDLRSQRCLEPETISHMSNV